MFKANKEIINLINQDLLGRLKLEQIMLEYKTLDYDKIKEYLILFRKFLSFGYVLDETDRNGFLAYGKLSLNGYDSHFKHN